jgi:alkylation response protein AidB-like acyl-CoA dehydrogenase
MDFTFTEEQQLLEDTVKRFVAKDYGFEKRRAILGSPEGWSRQVWQDLADLGLLALLVPEEHGGLGAGPVETLLVMSALGAGMVVEPFMSSAVVATTLLRQAASAQQQAQWLPAMAAGEKIVTLAWEEPGARGDAAWVKTRAQRAADGYVLHGQKAVALHAPMADALIVSARVHGEPGDAEGLSLFLAPRDTPGLVLQAYPTVDGTRAAEVFLRNVYLPSSARLGEDGAGYDPLTVALDTGLAALCAEAVGALEAIFDATLEYLRTRSQFGQPIGRFQTLQHRAADMLLHLEQAKSMSYLAAVRCIDPDPLLRARFLSAAKVVIGRACRYVGQQAVQLHGGMGVTDELKVSHLFKRLLAIELTLGDTDSHRERFARLLD